MEVSISIINAKKRVSKYGAKIPILELEYNEGYILNIMKTNIPITKHKIKILPFFLFISTSCCSCCMIELSERKTPHVGHTFVFL